MKNFWTQHMSLLTVHFLFALFFVAGLTSVKAAALYGVTNTNNLIRFDSATPGTVVNVGAITGLQAGENILGIDFRPATGELYALGSTSRLYILNRATGAATTVAVLSVTLNGTDFGMDFNPVPDRLRVISNTGQNLRINPVNGATIVDGAINPGSPNITASAYINNFNGATTTTLFNIDSTTDQLFIQNPPNNGTQVLVGNLGLNVTETNGFDVLSSTNTAYAALTVGGNTGLYTINTATGAATLVGNIGTGATSLRGFAAETGTVSSNLLVYGLTNTNQLVKFNSARPGTILSTVSITGLAGGENLLGIDFRPATGQLFGLGSTSRLYTINLQTGAASAVGMAGAFTLTGTDFGFDFNPVPDRIRVISNTGQNLRLNPNDGTLTATDTPLNPGSPQVTASAYINNFAGTTTTTLYNIDSGNDSLFIQNPPNNGTQVLVGALGIDLGSVNGFDVGTNGAALAAVQLTGDTVSKLFSINLQTGAASFVGPIGAAVPLRGIAIAPGSTASRTVDFDGDFKTDFAVFRLSENFWYINRSSTNSFFGFPFGISTDNFVPGDYDGDGRTDVAVWRGTNGVFFVLRSSDNTIQAYQFGINGDEPIARDYDGDGKTDFAVARRTGGQMIWFVNNSTNNSFRIEQFGIDTDITAPGDYDGDGRFDLGVFRNGTFFMQRSRDGFGTGNFGMSNDLIVPGDYDGDGKTDLAVLRGGTQYNWFLLRSSDGGFTPKQFGLKPDFSAQGDYDGDGKTDISVWRATDGFFYVTRSSNGTAIERKFGLNGDYPIANFDTH